MSVNRTLPAELQISVARQLALSMKATEAVAYRLVSKTFSDIILETLAYTKRLARLDQEYPYPCIPFDVQRRFFEARAGSDLARLPCLRDYLDRILDQFDSMISSPLDEATRTALRQRIALHNWLYQSPDIWYPCFKYIDWRKVARPPPVICEHVEQDYCYDSKGHAASRAISLTPEISLEGVQIDEEDRDGRSEAGKALLACAALLTNERSAFDQTLASSSLGGVGTILDFAKSPAPTTLALSLDLSLRLDLPAYACSIIARVCQGDWFLDPNQIWEKIIAYGAEKVFEALRHGDDIAGISAQDGTVLRALRVKCPAGILETALAGISEDFQSRAFKDPQFRKFTIGSCRNMDFIRHIDRAGQFYRPELVMGAIESGSMDVLRFWIQEKGLAHMCPDLELRSLMQPAMHDDAEMLKLVTDAGLSIQRLTSSQGFRLWGLGLAVPAQTAAELSLCHTMIAYGSIDCLRLYVDLYGRLDAAIDNTFNLCFALMQRRDPKKPDHLAEVVTLVLEQGVELEAKFRAWPDGELKCAGWAALNEGNQFKVPRSVRQMIERHIDADERISKTQKAAMTSKTLDQDNVLPTYHYYSPLGWQLMPVTGNTATESALVPPNHTM